MTYPPPTLPGNLSDVPLFSISAHMAPNNGPGANLGLLSPWLPGPARYPEPMARTPVPPSVLDDLRKLCLLVSAHELDLLSAYLSLLLDTNRRVNLTAVRDRAAAWRRHIVDSLTLLPLLQDLSPGSRLIDVGSGGGLPGVPLAITRPDLRVTLLEATGKKARFLETCRRQLPLPNLAVLNARAEEAGQAPSHRERYDLATVRALGPLAELLEYTLPLVRVGGRVLAMKGPAVGQELQAAKHALAELGAGHADVFDAYPPSFAIDSVIVQVTKSRATPRRYPRAPGIPRRRPL